MTVLLYVALGLLWLATRYPPRCPKCGERCSAAESRYECWDCTDTKKMMGEAKKQAEE